MDMEVSNLIDLHHQKQTTISHISGSLKHSVYFGNGRPCCNQHITKDNVLTSLCSLRTLFLSDFNDSKSSAMNLEHLDPGSVERIIKFCYTAEICVEWEDMPRFIEAVSYLEISDIMDAL